MITYTEEKSTELKWFKGWYGAQSTIEKLTELGDEALERVEDFIQESFGRDLPTDVNINDLLAFGVDCIAEILGFENEEEFWNAKELKK